MASSKKFITNITKQTSKSKSASHHKKKNVSMSSSEEAIPQTNTKKVTKKTAVNFLDVLASDPELEIDHSGSSHSFDCGLWEGSIKESDLNNILASGKKSSATISVQFKQGEDEDWVDISIQDVYIIDNNNDGSQKSNCIIFGQTNHFNFFEVNDSFEWKTKFVFMPDKPTTNLRTYPLKKYVPHKDSKTSSDLIQNAFVSEMDAAISFRQSKSKKVKKTSKKKTLKSKLKKTSKQKH